MICYESVIKSTHSLEEDKNVNSLLFSFNLSLRRKGIEIDSCFGDEHVPL